MGRLEQDDAFGGFINEDEMIANNVRAMEPDVQQIDGFAAKYKDWQSAREADTAKNTRIRKSLNRLISTLETGIEKTKKTKFPKFVPFRDMVNPIKERITLSLHKAISQLEEHPPMSDDDVMKSFHGQIPDIMKDASKRPPKDWWNNAIEKSASFADDPVMYAGSLWYGADYKSDGNLTKALDELNPDIDSMQKAVAEPIGSKMGPETTKKPADFGGESEVTGSGSHVKTDDLRPSQTVVTQ